MWNSKIAPIRSAAVRVIVFGMILNVYWCEPARSEDGTAAFLRGLRQRQLFSLAESYCLRKLAAEDLPDAERLELTLELCRTYTEHAQQTAGTEQEDLWRRAHDTVSQQIGKAPTPASRLALEVQFLLVSAAQARHSRWQYELSPDDQRLRGQAAALLAGVIPQLQAKERSVEEQLRRETGPATESDTRLGLRALRSLRLHIHQTLATLLLDQAVLLPTGSADRTSALLAAEQCARRLDSDVLSEAAQQDRDLLLAQVSRLRADYRQADLILHRLETAALTPPVADRVLAERVRLLLDDGKATEAAQLLIQKEQATHALTDELRFLFVSSLAALWKVARDKGDSDLAQELRKQIDQRAQRWNEDSRSYWAIRCQHLLVSLDQVSILGEELAATVQRARAMYASGDLIGAEALYRETATAAGRAGRADAAMELGYTAASIQMKRGDLEGAASAFRNLCDEFAQHPRSAEAHLVGTYCLAKLFEQSRSGQDTSSIGLRRQAYADALRRHRDRFAGHPTAVEATWMLATLEEAGDQTSNALKYYAEIPPEHARGPEAQVAVARCYERLLQQLRAQGRAVESWQANAIEHLQRLAAQYPPAATSLSRLQVEVVVRLARILLSQDRPDFMRANQWLQRAVDSARAAAGNAQETNQADRTAWRGLLGTATQLRIVSLCGQQQWDEAVKLLNSLAADTPDDLLLVLQGLSQLLHNADAETRSGLGELQLAAAKRLADEFRELSPEQTTRLLECRAQGCVATKRLQEAIALYDQLLQQSPPNKNLTRTAPRVCLESGTSDHFEKSRSLWRMVESQSVPGSGEWKEARYHVALCCYRLGEYEMCEKLLGVTRLLYAESPDDALYQEFQQLEHDVKSRPPQPRPAVQE